MKRDKKGFVNGIEIVISFLIAAVLFGFVIGLYDFTIVEIYEPIHKTLNESLVNTGVNKNSSAYIEFINNYDETKGKNIPFNLIFIFMFIWAIVYSIVEARNGIKQSIFNVIFKTTGGIIFLLYLFSIIILKIVDYINTEIVDYLFSGVIIVYIPFYYWIYANWGVVMLLWVLVLILVNWFFGKEEQEVRLI